MKQLLICLIFSIVLTSCETVFQHTYVIKNSTNHKIEIFGYDKAETLTIINDSVKDASEVIIMEPDSEIKKIREAGYHADPQGIFDYLGIDSLVIVFDSRKRITYACDQPYAMDCQGKYNLMNYDDNYLKQKIGSSSQRDEYSYTYVFSEEDYEFAEWIK